MIYTYFGSGSGPPAIASPREVFPELEPADVVATSGKVCRKFAIKSSPGFWEDVLVREKVSSVLLLVFSSRATI